MARIRKVLRLIGVGALILGGIVGGILAAILLWTSLRPRITHRSRCPILAWIKPIDRSGILPTDYIELNATAIGPRILEPIHVRIYGDGLVERDTVMTIGGDAFGCPLHDSDKTLHVSQSTARFLLAKARDGGFCRLCSSYYNQAIWDGGLEEVTLSLHGKLKSVRNHNGNPPRLLDELSGTIWELSGIESIADPRKFSPEREAECRRIEEMRIHR